MKSAKRRMDFLAETMSNVLPFSSGYNSGEAKTMWRNTLNRQQERIVTTIQNYADTIFTQNVPPNHTKNCLIFAKIAQNLTMLAVKARNCCVALYCVSYLSDTKTLEEHWSQKV